MPIAVEKKDGTTLDMGVAIKDVLQSGDHIVIKTSFDAQHTTRSSWAFRFSIRYRQHDVLDSIVAGAVPKYYIKIIWLNLHDAISEV